MDRPDTGRYGLTSPSWAEPKSRIDPGRGREAFTVIADDFLIATRRTRDRSFTFAIEQLIRAHPLEALSPFEWADFNRLAQGLTIVGLNYSLIGNSLLPGQDWIFVDVKPAPPPFLDDQYTQLAFNPPDMWGKRAIGRAEHDSVDASGRYILDVKRPRKRRRRRSRRKSPWAEAVGPLYTEAGLAAALDWTVEQVREAEHLNALLSLETTDNEKLFPVAQVGPDGRVVRGLQWVLSQLTPRLIDRFTLAAWLNESLDDLGGASVWTRLRESSSVPEHVRELTLRFRSSLSR